MKTIIINSILLIIVAVFYILKTCGGLLLLLGCGSLYLCNKLKRSGYFKYNQSNNIVKVKYLDNIINL